MMGNRPIVTGLFEHVLKTELDDPDYDDLEDPGQEPEDPDYEQAGVNILFGQIINENRLGIILMKKAKSGKKK